MLQVGPGHCSVVTTGDSGDQWWMVYHAWVHGHTDQEPGRWDTLDNSMQLLIRTFRPDSGNSVLKTIKFKLQAMML